uniref:Uncharacterized protein n=1 Tax=Anguilla anguilla TaxID=7936 RepID=A0A0E9PJC7_ANGAN
MENTAFFLDSAAGLQIEAGSNWQSTRQCEK